MSTPDAAAFDPIFWFFHANWDRLWWTWQQAMQATTQWSFRSTVTTGDTEFLRHTDDNALEGLGTLSQWSDSYIDPAVSGVAYGPVQAEQPVVAEEAPILLGSGLAERGLRVRPGPDVSVRLKGINRLVIPGSFDAVLLADGEPIAREAFFNRRSPASAPTAGRWGASTSCSGSPPRRSPAVATRRCSSCPPRGRQDRATVPAERRRQPDPERPTAP